MARSNLSLKWLDVFQRVARLGSLQDVSEETGLSISTVSHHLKALENHLGVTLIDHQKRPMEVTTLGMSFLRHVDQAMAHIRSAELEMLAGDVAGFPDITLATIEEFEDDVVPALAKILAPKMRSSKLGLFTRASHDILQLLRQRKVMAGICAQPFQTVTEFQEQPLLRDPFVVVLPGQFVDRKQNRLHVTAEQCLAGDTNLPFLRYSSEQLIGRQIEAQLARLRLSLPNKFESDSTGSILGLVAEGRGWALTTPINIVRMRRLLPQLNVTRFPQQAFARYISLFSVADFPPETAELIASAVRQLIQKQMVDPFIEQYDWLADAFHVLPQGNA